MSNFPSSPFQILGTVRDDLRARREARREYRALARDLASYTSRSDVDDLLAVLDDRDGAEAEQIRAILTRNLRTHSLAS